jgi:hypothetical protein
MSRRIAWGSALAALLTALAATPVGAASSPACRTADLHVSRTLWAGATGNQITVFRVRNVSGRTCHTFGFFGVQLLGRRGRELRTRSRRVTNDSFGHQPKRRVTLRPRQHGSFRITTVTGAGYHCAEAWQVRLIAPDDTGRTTVKLRSHHILACQHGRIRIAPVQRDGGARP